MSEIVHLMTAAPIGPCSIVIFGASGDLAVRPIRIDLAYASAFGAGSSPEAYEMLLYEIMNGDQTLFVRAEMVERSWQFVQSILDTCKIDGPTNLAFYPAGTWGPAEADYLLSVGPHCWCEPCLPSIASRH